MQFMIYTLYNMLTIFLPFSSSSLCHQSFRVNTAARMESTGTANKIQVSQATADLLKQAKKLHWLKPREEMVEAKGKGFMITYWVEPKQAAASVTTSVARSNSLKLGSMELSPSSPPPSPLYSRRISNQTERLINWNIGRKKVHHCYFVADE